MSCKAVENGEVKRKGIASLEFYVGSKPQYYCYGYIDKMTDELINTCKECRKNVIFAQEDYDAVH